MTNRIINIFAFGVLGILWLGFAAALLINQEILNTVWLASRGWALPIQIVVGLLVLPVALGLWIWETSWPLWLRLILVVGLAWATLYTFLPRKAPSKLETVPQKG